MKSYTLLLFCISILSCTIDPTDYEAEIHTDTPNNYGFLESTSIHTDDYVIQIETINGKFYKGYNEFRLRVFEVDTNNPVPITDATFLPIFTTSSNEVNACPHSYMLEQKEDYWEGYVVFTESTFWDLYINFNSQGQSTEIRELIEVQTQENKNLSMTSFIGNDNLSYVIALISPRNPTVSYNEIVAGIYTYNEPISEDEGFPDPSQFSYSLVHNYTLKIDPRMPEPSMGNHSSPNNEDLVQQQDQNYHGLVNYTMTGNWTLNFILLNAEGDTIKGTEVPTDFTPGIEGEKSELFLDILF